MRVYRPDFRAYDGIVIEPVNFRFNAHGRFRYENQRNDEQQRYGKNKRRFDPRPHDMQ
jgi:hypothetical protein